MFFYKSPVIPEAGSAWNDRGDITPLDFDHDDLVIDGAEHDLDLSGIVGSQACLVLIRIRADCAVVGPNIYFKTKGNTYINNAARIYSKVLNTTHSRDIWVYTDATGKVTYKFSTNEWSTVYITIGGWFS